MLTPSDLSRAPDFELGGLTVSPSTRRVEIADQSLTLEPRVMQVLVLLARHPNEVVTRELLFDEVWGGAMVGDDSINRAVAGVRRAVELDPESLELETIPRSGYLLRVAGPAAGRPFARRTLVAGGAAVVAAAGAGSWWIQRNRRDSQVRALIDQADHALRFDAQNGREQATKLLERALAIEPRNGTALGLLAYAGASALAGIAPARPAGTMEQAVRSVQAALAVDPTEPNAMHASLLIERSAMDWTASDRRLRQILHRAPNNFFVLASLTAVLQSAGYNRESWDMNERMIALDPLAPGPQYRRALKYWIFGRNDAAFKAIDPLMRLWPHHPWVWNARFLIFAFTGRARAALAMIDDADSRPPTVTPQQMAQWRPTLAALNHPQPATVAAAREANLRAAENSPGQAAYGCMALSGIGELDAAFTIADGFLLGKGPLVTRQSSALRAALVDSPGWRRTQWMFTPPMAAFRADRRFGPLCEAIGLTAYWRHRGIKPDYLKA